MKSMKYCSLCGNQYEMDLGVHKEKRNTCPVCGFTIYIRFNQGCFYKTIYKEDNENLAPEYQKKLDESGYFEGVTV